MDHLDKKIFAWLLGTVLLGVIAGIAYNDFEDKTWRNYRARNTRGLRPAIRSARRKNELILH